MSTLRAAFTLVAWGYLVLVAGFLLVILAGCALYAWDYLRAACRPATPRTPEQRLAHDVFGPAADCLPAFAAHCARMDDAVRAAKLRLAGGTTHGLSYRTVEELLGTHEVEP